MTPTDALFEAAAVANGLALLFLSRTVRRLREELAVATALIDTYETVLVQYRRHVLARQFDSTHDLTQEHRPS